MAKTIPSLCLKYRWMTLDAVGCQLGGMSVQRSDLIRRGISCHPFKVVNVGAHDSRIFESRQFSYLRRQLAPGHVHLARNFVKTDALCSMNGSSSSGSERFVTTNVIISLTHGVLQNAERTNDGLVQSVDSFAERKDAVVATLKVSVAGNIEQELMPISGTGISAHEEKWWHIPDSIEEILPLPANFEECQQVLFRKFGSQIESRELLLRVLVHRSYYEQKIPGIIRDQGYVKLRSATDIDSGEVTQQFVEGWPSKIIPCMTFGDAHGEVRSQLALLGDSVIGLAVSSLLVRQHSSAGTVTERKAQLVSNSNLSRAWRTLLGPGEFVLNFGDMPSRSAAQSNMMADSCEAYIGALYAEQGFETAFNCVSNALLPVLVQADSGRNPVQSLSVHSTMAFRVLPEYRLVGVDNKNTQHEVCRVRVYVKGIRMATGMGMNQKLARVDAARKALEKWPKVFSVF